MEFKQILQKLKYSNRNNQSSLTKKIILNIHHITKTELIDIIEIINGTEDMAYQVKLIFILTTYLLYNNSSRDVIIKSTPLYGTLSTILARGLPLRTAITLNFITILLYVEDDGGSRNRTLTLHAQNSIRNSGCLTAMIHLFSSYMLHTETWQALCRCLAEVVRGSELNQNFCSHLVPLCVQRCLQGNPDVLLVLQSLLFNHKRNTNLFVETDGTSIFNRKDYLKLEASLQLLNTVIQNAEIEVISNMTRNSKLYENLQELLKIKDADSNVVKWTTIVLYYLDLKLKENDKYQNATTINFKRNMLHKESTINDTGILLQNIMSEILSYPSETRGHVPFNNVSYIPKKNTSIWNISRVIEERNLHNESNNTLEKKLTPQPNFKASRNERLSFSFLMNENLRFDKTDFNSRNNNHNKVNQAGLDAKKLIHSEEDYEYTNFCDSLITYNSKCENITDFKPIFVSTPKKRTPRLSSITKNTSTKRSFMELSIKSRIKERSFMKNLSKKITHENNLKHRSMGSRLLEAINESCTTVIKSVKNVFTGKKSSNIGKQNIADINSVKNKDQKSYCSYSFTNFMQRRESELMERKADKDVSSETNTLHTANTCHTCDDTLLLRQKFSSDEQLKYIAKKLKLGINLYGCDFKRISKTMWPRETYMTPNVLYNLYRKLLLK